MPKKSKEALINENTFDTISLLKSNNNVTLSEHTYDYVSPDTLYRIFVDTLYNNNGINFSVEDICENVKFLRDIFIPVQNKIATERISLENAKKYIQDVLNHASDYEIIHLYQSIRVNRILFDLFARTFQMMENRKMKS